MPLTKQDVEAFRKNNERLEALIDDIKKFGLKGMDSETLMSPEEAAKYIGYSTQYVYQKLNKEVPHIKRNRKVLYRKSDLDKWLDNNTVEPV